MKRPLNTHLFQRPARWGVLPLLALALTACGGGSEESAIFQPGEVVTFAATLPDGSTQESHYLMHGVTADGDLLVDDVSEKMSVGPRKRPPLAGVLVALPLESGDYQQGDTPRLASLRVFYKQLWQGIAERRNDGSDIAAEIGAYETDVGALYEDFQVSGFFSVKDYVTFYEQVGENPYFGEQEWVEEELVEFFYRTGWAQGNWVRALERLSPVLTWPDFLNVMASRKDSFASLLHLWHELNLRRQVPITMDEFIGRYVGRSKAASLDDVAKADASQDTGAEKFFVTNKSWGVRINSSEQSSVAILSSQDTNISNYHRVGEKKEICPTKLSIRGRLGVAQADLEWKMKYTEEKHASLPGTFLSSFGMDVFRAVGYEGEIREVDDPNGGFYQTGGTAFFNRQLIKSLSVNMEIKDLKNIGTEAAPRPGFTARVKVTPSFIFNSPWVRTCEVK